MAWFEFSQNNSGGSFTIRPEYGIGPVVWIEANDAEDACERAQNIGIYFNGVEDGMDCECCGDRWHRPWDSGEEYPAVDSRWDFGWHKEVYFHPQDGKFVSANKNNYQEVLTQFIPVNLGHA